MIEWLDEVMNSELTFRWFVGLHLVGAGLVGAGYVYDEFSSRYNDRGEIIGGIGMLIIFGFWAYMMLLVVLRLGAWVVTGE